MILFAIGLHGEIFILSRSRGMPANYPIPKHNTLRYTFFRHNSRDAQQDRFTMSGDYYNLLGITKEADKEDIAKAYRKMALKFHPDLNKDLGVDTRASFARVSEAYEVLNDPRLRALYDDYGDDGLKQGANGAGYKYSDNADGIFKTFFGVANPFQVMGSSGESTRHLFFSDTAAAAKLAQPSPKEIEIQCTLEELYSGARRQVEVPVAHFDREGKQYRSTKNQIPITIAPGLPQGSSLKFIGKGDEKDGATSGDVHVTVTQVKHKDFEWKGDNLVFTQKITLEEALVGFSVEVHTLDNRRLSLFINDVVHPKYTKVVSGEGMPVLNGNGKRGDLVLNFEAEFPKYLTDGQKKEIARVFSTDKPQSGTRPA